MKKAVVFVAAGGLLLSGIGLGPHVPASAFSAELDGFAINTQDKAVTITLYTDQRVPYTTEHQGKQFTIILPETQLSQQQVNNGLPVVIDNKNRFIGRAVPTEDGKVKIILPNLPANDYAVSIQQKRPGQTAPAAVSNSAPAAESIKPRPAVNPSTGGNFEQVAANFPKPARHGKVANRSANLKPAAIRLSPTPHKVASSAVSGNGSVWNPYVVKTPSVPAIGNSTYSNYQPVPAYQQNHAAPSQAFQPGTPINTVSVAESMANNPTLGVRQPAPMKDPLWYLHSLPPATHGNLPAETLTGPAATETQPSQVSQKTPATANTTPASPKLTLGLKEAITALPKWLLITLAVFLGGIGIFTSIGGLVLLRVLFSQAKQQFMPQALFTPGMQQPMATGNDIQGQQPNHTHGKPGYATHPNGMSPLGFQDTAAVSSMDFLKESPGNIAQAVQNAVLVKFPSHKKHRSGLRRSAAAPRKTGTAPAYGLKP